MPGSRYSSHAAWLPWLRRKHVFFYYYSYFLILRRFGKVCRLLLQRYSEEVYSFAHWRSKCFLLSSWDTLCLCCQARHFEVSVWKDRGKIWSLEGEGQRGGLSSNHGPTSWEVPAALVKARQAGRCLSADPGCVSAGVSSTNEVLPVEQKVRYE